MTKGLVRYQASGNLHFLTFSCDQRRPYLLESGAAEVFVRSLEAMRVRYDFLVYGYVVMPEHVHLLVSEPKKVALGKAVQALKLSVAAKRTERPFWLARYYDFNVFSEAKRVEKLSYMHRNPVSRGLVGTPEEWEWSSFRHYAMGEIGVVEIESPWTARWREAAATETHVSEARRGEPDSLPVFKN